MGGLGLQRLRVIVTRPVGWGGQFTDSGSTIADEKQRPVPQLSYHANGPPPNVADNNNMTIRRIYNNKNWMTQAVSNVGIEKRKGRQKKNTNEQQERKKEDRTKGEYAYFRLAGSAGRVYHRDEITKKQNPPPTKARK